MSSDAGLTLLREVERRHDLAGLLASCLTDQRDPGKIRHSLDDIIRFRVMMISAGYEDGNDASDLRHDPSFKIALERNPQTGAALCSQPTISRMENLPGVRDLIRMARSMVRFYCQRLIPLMPVAPHLVKRCCRRGAETWSWGQAS
jgi:hypothetical protein